MHPSLTNASKIVLAVVSLAVGVGSLLVAPASTRAQALTGSCTAPGGNQGHYEGTVCVPDKTEGSACYTNDVPARSGTYDASGNCTATAATSGSDAAARTPAAPGAGFDGSEIFTGVLNYIAVLLAWLVAVAAITLENVVLHTVVHMGNYVNNLSAVGVTWRIFRDIGNIALLFGFVVLGLSVILDVNWYGGGYRFLPKLLMAAVALNFSLFAAEAVIDVGNLFATQFYTQINGGKRAQSTGYDETGSEGISNKLMSQIGLVDIYGKAQSDQTIFDKDYSFTIAFMTIILLMIVTFVLFSLAFMLLSRFVMLVLIIISSPIGVAGLGIPKLEGLARRWWSELVKQTITAPVLLLLLYVALAVITDRNFIRGFVNQDTLPSWLSFIDGKDLTGFAGVLLSFLVAMGLLLAVMTAAKSMGAAGADWAMRMGSRLSFGAVSFMGGAVIGGGGRILNKRYEARAKDSWGAWAASRTGRFASSRTYDLRRLPLLQSTTSLVTGGKVNLGKPISTTARDVAEKAGPFGKKWWNELGKEARAEEDKALRRVTVQDAPERIAAHESEIARLRALLQEEQRKSPDAQDTEKIERLSKAIAEENDSLHKYQLAIAQATPKQLEELAGIKNASEKLVQMLSPQQFLALMKSDNLSEPQKEKLVQARFANLAGAVKNLAEEKAKWGDRYDENSSKNAAEVKKALKALSDGELTALPPGLVAGVVDELSDKQRDVFTKSDGRTSFEKNFIRERSAVGRVDAAFKEAFKTVLGSRDENALTPEQAAELREEAVKEMLKNDKVEAMVRAKLTAAQMAKLDTKIVTSQAMAAYVNSEVVRKKVDEGDLSPAEMAAWGKNIDASSNEKLKDAIRKGAFTTTVGYDLPPRKTKTKTKTSTEAEKTPSGKAGGGEPANPPGTILDSSGNPMNKV